jgi:hypothetical protein
MPVANPGINWVAPTIFDAAAEPGILLPLVLANAASPQLWRLRDRILAAQQLKGGAADPIALLQPWPAFAPPWLGRWRPVSWIRPVMTSSP